MSEKDYYKILGVSKDASQEDVKAAFRRLAHQHHPDKAGGDVEKFKEINAAYQILSDPEKRKKYDQFGSAYEQMGGGSGGFGGFDFSQAGFGPGGIKFEFGDMGDIFGDLFGMGGGRRGGRQARGRDIETEVRLTFREAAFGVEKPLQLYRLVECGECGATGAEKGSKTVKCRDCGGSGRTIQMQQTILGSFRSERTCQTCGGDGNVPEKICRKCAGTGFAKGTRDITLKIPAGVSDGDVLRVAGEGEPGGKNVRPGDLHVRMAVSRDPRFERRGFDIVSRLEVPMHKAALGAEVEVETLDGAVELKIPAGTQSGAVFRLKGKGIPHLKKSGRGDHLIETVILTPTKLSRKQRKTLEEWDGL